MKYCTQCGKKNISNSNFCEFCGEKINNKYTITSETEKKAKGKTKSSKYIMVLTSLVIILSICGYWWKTTSSAKAEFMKKYESAISLVNKGELEKGKSALEDIKTEDKYDDVDVENTIKLVSDLFDIQVAILEENDNLSSQIEKFNSNYAGKYDNIKTLVNNILADSKVLNKYLETAKKLKDFQKNNDFDKAESELKSLKEYKFTTEKISKEFEKKVADIESKLANAKKQFDETKTKESQANTSSGGVGDNDVIPAGSSYVFSGTVTNSTTYKEFRQTNAYQTIASNYVGFNASNAEIKACLEWLIQKGKEGAQVMPSTDEYRKAFGR